MGGAGLRLVLHCWIAETENCLSSSVPSSVCYGLEGTWVPFSPVPFALCRAA